MRFLSLLLLLPAALYSFNVGSFLYCIVDSENSENDMTVSFIPQISHTISTTTPLSTKQNSSSERLLSSSISTDIAPSSAVELNTQLIDTDYTLTDLETSFLEDDFDEFSFELEE
ncbi:MAG: hypothetical protein MK080_06190 [Opitutales bacterium]|nr:hypothetical protein [Opitutales bacterium]NRA27267.1 hypothetical protein [Opitutales bacterium]